jgi:hypothetical protein
MIDEMMQLKNFFVLRSPGGIDDAEELKIRVSGILYILLGVGGNVDGLTGADFRGFLIDVYDACSLQDIINLRGLKPMRQ